MGTKRCLRGERLERGSREAKQYFQPKFKTKEVQSLEACPEDSYDQTLEGHVHSVHI